MYSQDSARSVSVVQSVVLLAGVAAALSLLGISACGSDTPGQRGCQSHGDCDLGYACSADNECVQVPCNDQGECDEDEDLICYQTPKNPKGTCSRPECQSASDCEEPGETCKDGLCKPGCTSDEDCSDGERCNAYGRCVAKPTDAGTDAGDTGDAGTDDTSVPDTSSDAGLDTSGGDTEDIGGDTSCDEMEDCSQSGNPDADKWSNEYCACVECLSDSGCGDGEECRGGICRPECAQENKCSGSDECSGDRPYCISSCCVECVGAMDCSGDRVCVDGSCQDAPSDCTTSDAGNPCPTGYECDTSTGKCKQTSSGQECSSSNPCPGDEYCDNGTCKAPTGGQNCGLCGTNCSCPGQTQCQQFACVGCDTSAPLQSCPDGQFCVPPLSSGGQPFCFPLSF